MEGLSSTGLPRLVIKVLGLLGLLARARQPFTRWRHYVILQTLFFPLKTSCHHQYSLTFLGGTLHPPNNRPLVWGIMTFARQFSFHWMLHAILQTVSFSLEASWHPPESLTLLVDILLSSRQYPYPVRRHVILQRVLLSLEKNWILQTGLFSLDASCNPPHSLTLLGYIMLSSKQSFHSWRHYVILQTASFSLKASYHPPYSLTLLGGTLHLPDNLPLLGGSMISSRQSSSPWRHPVILQTVLLFLDTPYHR